MSHKPRSTFSPEFKREAVRLLSLGNKEASQIARELGIKRNQLYKWKDEVDQYGAGAFPGHGNRPRKMNDSSALKMENNRLREENEILKKAAIFFAKELD